jgi:hypothetical protein
MRKKHQHIFTPGSHILWILKILGNKNVILQETTKNEGKLIR